MLVLSDRTHKLLCFNYNKKDSCGTFKANKFMVTYTFIGQSLNHLKEYMDLKGG